MNFYALRVSLVATEPQLFIGKNMSKDILSFEDALNHSVGEPPQNEQGHVLFSIKVSVYDRNTGAMAGMVAKAKSLHGHDSDFNEYSVDDYPPMVWFWDREQQVVLLEKKTTVFSTPTAACKAFEKIANNYELAMLGIRAEIEPVLNRNEQNFWDEYDKFEVVQSVTFELTPPNLFGETEKEMKKALNDTAKSTNANKVTAIFENKDKKLKLKNDSWVGNLISWCRKGGGHWSLKGHLHGKKTQMTVKSEKTAKIVHMKGQGITEVTLTNYAPHDVKDIVELYRDDYRYDDGIEKVS
ncbi:hypothetical protein BCT23_13445 [Enterovibrio norvegicus]|uniref:Uncharacterized protein n=2 Tax=Enterovibrio norvegicus TaxID=188144 RepID=A0A2N7LDF4_9GAMM|nr:hypothetical protein BCU47_06330 [Enterovibrio norvegicus]PML81496.1 hypothetical protein BCT69_07370 [Enterovibrio norvegicus]PMN93409.1 hypothetical protein BCT23_13445 [Enterovibrio norvegicus]